MPSEPETEDATVYILIGRVWKAKPDEGAATNGATIDVEGGDEKGIPVNVLLTAEDDETCIKRGLAALAGQGYGRVELDRVGIIDAEPEDQTFAAAYWNAIDGEVAVIAFHG